MTENNELMVLRGKYATLQKELFDIQSKVDINSLKIRVFLEYLGNPYSELRDRNERLETQDCILKCLHLIMERLDNAEPIHEELLRIKPLCGL